MHGINFFEYLSDILNRSCILIGTASADAYRDLLPDRWTPLAKNKSRVIGTAFILQYVIAETLTIKP